MIYLFRDNPYRAFFRTRARLISIVVTDGGGRGCIFLRFCNILLKSAALLANAASQPKPFTLSLLDNRFLVRN